MRNIFFYSFNFFTTLAGFPITTQLSGTSSTTTLPTEIMEFSPIVTPDIIIEPGLITAPFFIFTCCHNYLWLSGKITSLFRQVVTI